MLGWHVVASYHDCVACSATTVSSLVTVHEQMLFFFPDDTVRQYEHVNNLRKSIELFFLKNSEKMKIVRSTKIYFFPGKYQTKTEAKRYKYMEYCRMYACARARVCSFKKKITRSPGQWSFQPTH